jgi:hypothetical protein
MLNLSDKVSIVRFAKMSFMSLVEVGWPYEKHKSSILSTCSFSSRMVSLEPQPREYQGSAALPHSSQHAYYPAPPAPPFLHPQA